MKDTILFGDCRETLKQFDEKARVCVTSPPYYGLRDYGGENNQIGQEQTPEEYVDEMVKVFRLVRDCLTDDGTLWLNIGDSYYNYRPGKGQSYPKQTVSKTKQDLPELCNKRGNKLEGLKEKDLKELLNLSNKNLFNANVNSWQEVLPLYPISPIN